MTATNPTWDSTTGTSLTWDAQNPNKILKQWLSRHKAWNIPKQWPLRTERGEKEPCHYTMAGHPGRGWASELDTKLRVQTDQHNKSSKLTDYQGTVGIQTVPLLRNQSLCVRRVLKTSEDYTVVPSVPSWQGIPTLAKSQIDLNPEVLQQRNLPNKAKGQNSKVYNPSDELNYTTQCIQEYL